MQPLIAKTLIVFTLLLGGCASHANRWTPWSSPPPPAAPEVLPPSPTLDQVIAAVHANSLLVNSFSANNVTISTPSAPVSLRGQLAVERPKRIRLTASHLAGKEVDFGSNDELFWVWIKRMQPASLMMCRHDQFHQSVARKQMPIEPQWLLDALGMSTFDPQGAHQGPEARHDGALVIRSTIPVPGGVALANGTRPTEWIHKITIVDPRRAWVLEQHLYDPNKSTSVPFASAVSSNYQYDPMSGASLPRHVELRMPESQFSLTLDLSNMVVNQVVGDPAFLWQPPSQPGVPVVDLGQSVSRPVSAPHGNTIPTSQYQAPIMRRP